jgi:predicted HAD superfamily Cof-like phosphohydrolase
MQATKQPEIVDQWAKILIERLHKKLDKFKIGKSGALRKSIKTDLLRGVGGDIDKLHLLYNYYGAFVDMGVGRGQPLGEVRYAKASQRLTGIKARRAKKWYSVTITAEVNTLADLLMKHYGKQAIGVVLNEIPTQISI